MMGVHSAASARRTIGGWTGAAVAAAGLAAGTAWAVPEAAYGEMAGVAAALGAALLAILLVRQTRSRARAEKSAIVNAGAVRILGEASRDMIFRLDLNFTRTYVSPASVDLLGLTPEEMVGNKPVQIVHPDDMGTMVSTFEALKAGQDRARMTVRSRHVKGHWVWADVTFQLLRDPVTGAPAEIFGTVRDITEKMQSEQALQRAEESARANADLLQDAMEALPDGFVVYDTDTRRVMMNRRFRELHGENPLSEDSRAPLEQVLRAAIDAGELHVPPGADADSWIRERLENHRRGSYEYIQQSRGRWIRILERKMRDGRTVAVHSDISELKAAQHAAESANLAKSQFLTNMSHELRTPLNAVLGFAQLLEANRPRNLVEDQKDYISRIVSGGEHLLNLINEVLDLSGIEAGKLKLSIGRVRVDELMQEVRSAMMPLADRAHVSLTVDADESAVQADETRLRQVLLNLISNGIKYNREDGSVQVSARPTSNGRVRFSVTDTGRGIAVESQGSLFQPFQRLGAEHSGIEGTGVGLAISKRLIEAMHGTIAAESAPGVGSTFWFELPAASGEPDRDRGADAAIYQLPYLAAGKHSILYVEDNPANLDLVEQIFATISNIKLLSAQSPSAGLDMAAAQRPDLILLDITLPEMSGYDFLANIRAKPETQHIPVVALTALAMPHDVERGLKAGFFRYLTKPLDVQALLTAVREGLDENMLRQPAADA